MMTPRQWRLGAGVALVGGLGWLLLLDVDVDAPATAAKAERTARPAGAGGRAVAAAAPAGAASALGPTLRALRPRDPSEPERDAGAVRPGLFGTQTETPVAAAPPPAPAPVAETPRDPPPPQAPPLPFQYVGQQLREGRSEAFLALGDRTWVVVPGSLLTEQYRVDAIQPSRIQFTYLPLNQRQELATGRPPG